MRELKDGWTIHKEWVDTKTDDRRTHWVSTDCLSCSAEVAMPLKELVANGPESCPGCEAYQEHLY